MDSNDPILGNLGIDYTYDHQSWLASVISEIKTIINIHVKK